MVTISNEPCVPKADAKILRIARPYGGVVVFEAAAARGLTAFYKRAAAWFDRAAAEDDFLPLSLFPDEPMHERELSAFRDEARTWSFTGDVRVSYEPPLRALDERFPPPVQGQAYPLAAGIERRAVSSFVLHSRANEPLKESERGIVVTYQERSEFVDVELRHPEIAKVRDAATAISGVAEDVLDVLIANAFLNAPSSYGMFSIAIDAILDARGVLKKRKGDGSKSYTAGHHEQARRDIGKALVDLNNLWVAGAERNPGRGRRKAVAWQRVLLMDRLYTASGETREVRDRATLDELDPKTFIAIEYALGSWFEALRSTSVGIQAPRELLQLNARNAGPAKDLGRYFTQRRAEADSDGRLVRSVQDVFEDLVWRAETDDPGATRLRLERALAKLVESRILLAWGYVEDRATLPARGWLDVWMRHHLWVHFSPV